MKVTPIDPPRLFETGRGEKIHIADCARIALEPNEQVTFTTESGAEYDVARKGWGFYATPSINGRLLNFGLRAALAKSYVGKYYLFLVEKGHEQELESYLAKESNALVRWLDNDQDLAAIEDPNASFGGATNPSLHCMCGADRFTTVHMYWEPPVGEVRLPLPDGVPYRREVFRCNLCGHFVSVHSMDTDASFYTGQYVSATYGDEERLRRTYERIVALPEDRSDNAGRVRRVVLAATQYLPAASQHSPSVLDVGSGLCVFLQRIKSQHGWTCTALDPDPRAARHARDVVGVSAVEGDFASAADQLGQYDVITFNKVLEHVKDPAALLRRSIGHVSPGGFVYVELPDGEGAARDGFGREEFFVEHFHVFSMASIALLGERAGFEVLTVERLREPSTKYTLRAFLRPRGNQ